MLFRGPCTKDKAGRCCRYTQRTLTSQRAGAHLYFHFASGISIPNTRTTVRLLGPCFKTGEQSPYNSLKSHVRHEQTSLGIRGSGKPSHTYRPKAFKCLPQQFPLLAAPAQAQLLQTQPNAFIFIKTPRNPQQLHEQEPYATNRLCPLLLAVSSTFNSLFKVLFTFPSRYL